MKRYAASGPLADYTIGQRVMTVEGYPGTVEDIHEGPADLTTIWVRLDNDLGGGEYAEAELSPLQQQSSQLASVEHTAVDDYPELGTILSDRLPPQITTVRTAAKQATSDEAADWDDASAHEDMEGDSYVDPPYPEDAATAVASHLALYLPIKPTKDQGSSNESLTPNQKAGYDEGFSHGREGITRNPSRPGDPDYMAGYDTGWSEGVLVLREPANSWTQDDLASQQIGGSPADPLGAMASVEAGFGDFLRGDPTPNKGWGGVGKAYSFDWCRFRRDSHCWLSKDLNEEASKEAGYAVWNPVDRGYCSRVKWSAQQKCPTGEPGPHSGQGALLDATVPWEQGGQHGGVPSGLYRDSAVDLGLPKVRAGLSDTEHPVPGIVREYAMTPVGNEPYAEEMDDISRAYRDMPILDPGAVAIWQELGALCRAQAESLKRLYTVIRLDHTDPYMTADEMYADVDRGIYKVTSLHSHHPVWDVDTNVAFRVVHDLTGHTTSHSDFSLRGEVIAYQNQCAQTPEHLWPALFTEIVAQSAYANVHHLFGEQKVGVISLTKEEIAEHCGRIMDAVDPEYDRMHQSASLSTEAEMGRFGRWDVPAEPEYQEEFPGSFIYGNRWAALWYSKGTHMDPGGITIHAVQVEPSHQRQGLATQLLDDMAERFEGHTVDPGGLTEQGAPLWLGWVAKNEWPPDPYTAHGVLLEDPYSYDDEDLDAEASLDTSISATAATFYRGMFFEGALPDSDAEIVARLDQPYGDHWTTSRHLAEAFATEHGAGNYMSPSDHVDGWGVVIVAESDETPVEHNEWPFDEGETEAPRHATSTVAEVYHGKTKVRSIRLSRLQSTAAFEVTATWAEVRAKAKRIRSTGGVRVIAAKDNVIVGHIRGDHGIYETELVRNPGRHNAAYWHCGCKWAAYAWGRSAPFKRFEGRMCSHALALHYEADARRMFGRELTLDEKQPAWMDQAHVHRPGDYNRDTQRYTHLKAVEASWSPENDTEDTTPVQALAGAMLASGEPYKAVRAMLVDHGVTEPLPVIKAAKQAAKTIPFKGKVKGRTVDLVIADDGHVHEHGADGEHIDHREVVYPGWDPRLGLNPNDVGKVGAASLTWDQVKAKYPVYSAAWHMDDGVNEVALGGPQWDGQPEPLRYVETTVNPHQVRFERYEATDSRVQAVLKGGSIPPVLLVERGGELITVDGHHRLSAAVHQGLSSVPAVVAQSPREDKYTGGALIGTIGKTAASGPTPASLPNVGPVADDFWGGGGCGQFACAFVALVPGLKIAVEWGTGHDEGLVAHATAYDPATKRSFDFSGTDTVDIALGNFGGPVEYDVDPQRVAESMRFRFSLDEPWDDDTVSEAADVIVEHWHLSWDTIGAKKNDGPQVSGVALMAADTGRVLMLQRGLDDKKDPARGTWEFPGGHHEEGDTTSLHAGIREWEEEVGQAFPEGGYVHHTWQSPNGVYQGHVVVIPEEKAVVLHNGRSEDNPDDPGGDKSEQAAWWTVEHAKKNPALRPECKASPWKELARAVEQTKTASSDDAPYVEVKHDDRLHTWQCSKCGETQPGRGYRDETTNRENAEAHAMWCHDLDWGDTPSVKTSAKGEWRRHPNGEGYIHHTGDWYLERQSRMQGGNTNGWAILRRTPETEIGRDDRHPYHTKSGDTLQEIDGVLYHHHGDEGSLADAKFAVEYHRKKGARVQPGVYYHVAAYRDWPSIRDNGLRSHDDSPIWVWTETDQAVHFSDSFGNPDVPPCIVVIRSDRAYLDPSRIWGDKAYRIPNPVTKAEVYDVIRPEDLHHYDTRTASLITPKEGSTMETPDEYGSLFDGAFEAGPIQAAAAAAPVDQWGLSLFSTFHEEPEPALPSTDGADDDEADKVAARLAAALAAPAPAPAPRQTQAAGTNVTCFKCGQAIQDGQDLTMEAGKGIAHKVCPAPKQAAQRVEAGFPLCAKGCGWTLSADAPMTNTTAGLAHADCATRQAAPVAPPAPRQAAAGARMPGESDDAYGKRLLALVDSGQGGAVFSHLTSSTDTEVAAAAQQYLATGGASAGGGGIQGHGNESVTGVSKEALKAYDLSERKAIIAEGEGGDTASNLDRLDVSGTHYESMMAHATQAPSAQALARQANGGRDVPEDEDMWMLDGDPNLADV